MRNVNYSAVKVHELAEVYRRLEILRPVMIPDPSQRRQFRALDVCQICDGDHKQAISRQYGYGPILPPDDELEDFMKNVLRLRKEVC